MNPGSLSDIFFLALILIMTLRAALRGFISEVFSLAAIALAILAAVLFYRKGAAFIRAQFQWEARLFTEVLAFILLFLIVFVAVRLIDSVLKDIIERVNLGWIDRLLGVVIGMAEGLALTALLLFILSVQPLFNPAPLFEGSVFAKNLLPLINAVPLPTEFPPQIPVPDSYV
ncbi:MAG: CvpA family protein [Treponema sp.]|jgi:membrane protein required for colicin V production|nr:CvpA family protein [Treponema sp.]